MFQRRLATSLSAIGSQTPFELGDRIVIHVDDAGFLGVVGKLSLFVDCSQAIAHLGQQTQCDRTIKVCSSFDLDIHGTRVGKQRLPVFVHRHRIARISVAFHRRRWCPQSQPTGGGQREIKSQLGHEVPRVWSAGLSSNHAAILNQFQPLEIDSPDSTRHDRHRSGLVELHAFTWFAARNLEF